MIILDTYFAVELLAGVGFVSVELVRVVFVTVEFAAGVLLLVFLNNGEIAVTTMLRSETTPRPKTTVMKRLLF